MTLYWSCEGQKLPERSWEGYHGQGHVLGMCLGFYRTQIASLRAKLQLFEICLTKCHYFLPILTSHVQNFKEGTMYKKIMNVLLKSSNIIYAMCIKWQLFFPRKSYNCHFERVTGDPVGTWQTGGYLANVWLNSMSD